MDFLKFIRSCAVCNSFTPPIDWLCPHCWKLMEREYLSCADVYRTEESLSHLRLFDWHEGNDSLIKKFINSLKKGGPEFIFKRLALECFPRFVYTPCWPKEKNPFVFVPAPPAHSLQVDHASELARLLCHYFGGKTFPALQRLGADRQKRKGKKDRAVIQLLARKGLKRNLKNKTILFVDDVLTTGSTARAAFKALDSPEKFVICTLAWKRPPQPQRDFS